MFLGDVVCVVLFLGRRGVLFATGHHLAPAGADRR